MFPQGDAHVLSSAPGMRAAPDMAMFARPTTPLPLMYELGGGGERARIVCGFLGCDERPYNPLLAALPPVIHLPAAGGQPTGGWLGTLLNIAIGGIGQRARRRREHPGPGVRADVRGGGASLSRDASAGRDGLARRIT